MPQYCRKMPKGAVGLYSIYGFPKDEFGREVWVCADCFFPSKAIFEKFIQRCEDCLSEFSSPWEEVCSKCHKITHSEIIIKNGTVRVGPVSPDAPPWQGWVWARQRMIGVKSEREKYVVRPGKAFQGGLQKIKN